MVEVHLIDIRHHLLYGEDQQLVAHLLDFTRLPYLVTVHDEELIDLEQHLVIVQGLWSTIRLLDGCYTCLNDVL